MLPSFFPFSPLPLKSSSQRGDAVMTTKVLSECLLGKLTFPEVRPPFYPSPYLCAHIPRLSSTLGRTLLDMGILAGPESWPALTSLASEKAIYCINIRNKFNKTEALFFFSKLHRLIHKIVSSQKYILHLKHMKKHSWSFWNINNFFIWQKRLLWKSACLQSPGLG